MSTDAKQTGKPLVEVLLQCDYEVRKPVADHFEYVPCNRPGKVCTSGPMWQRGSIRCKRHAKSK